MKCPYCSTEQGEIQVQQSEPWIVVSQVVANEFQGYTKQREEEVRAIACPNCGKGFMVKNDPITNMENNPYLPE